GAWAGGASPAGASVAGAGAGAASATGVSLGAGAASARGGSDGPSRRERRARSPTTVPTTTSAGTPNRTRSGIWSITGPVSQPARVRRARLAARARDDALEPVGEPVGGEVRVLLGRGRREEVLEARVDRLDLLDRFCAARAEARGQAGAQVAEEVAQADALGAHGRREDDDEEGHEDGDANGEDKNTHGSSVSHVRAPATRGALAHRTFTPSLGRLLAHPLGDDGRHTVPAHRDAVERVGDLHRALLVRHDDELGVLAQLGEDLQEAPEVRVIERRLDLVHDVEG